jgi:hypothetical protein
MTHTPFSFRLEATEGAARGGFRFRARQPAVDQIVGEVVQVRAQFVVERAVARRAAEQAGDACEPDAERGHQLTRPG